MRNTARRTRENRTITVDFRSEATYVQLLGDGKAFLECVLAFIMALGFQLKHKPPVAGMGGNSVGRDCRSANRRPAIEVPPFLGGTVYHKSR